MTPTTGIRDRSPGTTTVRRAAVCRANDDLVRRQGRLVRGRSVTIKSNENDKNGRILVEDTRKSENK